MLSVLFYQGFLFMKVDRTSGGFVALQVIAESADRLSRGLPTPGIEFAN